MVRAMDDLDDYADDAFWFAVRPVRSGEPAPGALWGSTLAIGGLVMLAMAFKRIARLPRSGVCATPDPARAIPATR